jgi:hypothetical protein
MYANRFFTSVVILAFVAVIALIVREAFATSTIALDPQALETQRLERSRAADAARWTAMGEYYEQLNGAQNMERSRAADSARWTAMGEYYGNLEAAQLQRSRAADTARWNAMAEYYRLMNLATP